MDRALVSFEQYLYKWWEVNLKMLMDHIHVISSHPHHRQHQYNLKYQLCNYVICGDVIPFRLELRMKHASSPNLSILVDVACWRYFTARRTGILAWPAEAELSWLLIGQFDVQMQLRNGHIVNPLRNDDVIIKPIPIFYNQRRKRVTKTKIKRNRGWKDWICFWNDFGNIEKPRVDGIWLVNGGCGYDGWLVDSFAS